MDKKQKKELEFNLVNSISNFLNEINAESAMSIKKTIRKESQHIIRKFSKALKKTKAPKKNVLSETAK